MPDSPLPPTKRLPGTRRFEVGARFGLVHGGGHLLVAPGSITLVPGRSSRVMWKTFEAPYRRPPTELQSLSHTKPAVEVIEARFGLPWLNTAVVVEADHETALASLPGWMRRTVVRALAEAGFVVEVTRTTFSLAGGRAGPTR